MEIITTHTNSDFDSLGAMVGARLLYPDAKCVFPGSTEMTVRRFFIESSSYAAGFSRLKDVDLSAVTLLVVVDTDGISRIGPFGPVAVRPGVEVHVYDHHPEPPDPLPAKVKVNEKVGAATTLLTELVIERGLRPTPDEATMMMLGVFEDTGGLTFVTTTPRDFRAAAFLAECGADLSTVREFVTPELTAAQVALLDELIKNRVTHNFGGVEVSVSTAAIEEYVGDLALLAHKLCDMEELPALVVYVRMDDRIHLVCRSRVPEFDGSVVARHFGGGGHPEAASASVKDKTPQEMEEELAAVLPFAVRPRRTASDLLSSPAKTFESGQTLAEARELLNRYHVNAAPVVRDGALVGILTRLVVERAMSHGLFDAAVDAYMTTDFQTIAPGAPMDALREIIVGNRQRLVPVMEGGALVGVVTRTDLLQALAPEGQAKAKGYPKSVRRLAADLVDPPVLEKLMETGRVALEAGMSAYLVGGMVRDLVLRTKNIDVDVVVEGDAIELAKTLAARWKGRMHPHPAFSTAKIKCADGFEMDVATARTEYYARPAALPTVEQSSLKLDLTRRDFTINALAMRLEPDRFGELVDFFGSLRDIKERQIRILHNLSFVEDPTRVLRAVRFSLRFGFAIGGQTRRLFKSSISEGFLAKAAGPRLAREWKLLFEEVNPLEAAGALFEAGILEKLHPGVALDAKTRELLVGCAEVWNWYRLLYLERDSSRWKLATLALVDRLSDGELSVFGSALGLSLPEREWFSAARHASNRLLASLRLAIMREKATDGEVYRLCRGEDEDTLLFSMARTKDTQKRRLISRYHTALSGARTILGGGDLKNLGIPPGPAYREILDSLLYAKLDGKVATRAAEEAFVLAKWDGITGKNDFVAKVDAPHGDDKLG